MRQWVLVVVLLGVVAAVVATVKWVSQAKAVRQAPKDAWGEKLHELAVRLAAILTFGGALFLGATFSMMVLDDQAATSGVLSDVGFAFALGIVVIFVSLRVVFTRTADRLEDKWLSDRS